MSRPLRIPKEELPADRLDVPDIYIATLEGVRTPEQALMDKQQTLRLERHLDTLQPRYGLAVRMYYGIRTEPHTLDQIGALYGVTRERVRQIVMRGVRNLRYRMMMEERPADWRKVRAEEKAKRIAKEIDWIRQRDERDAEYAAGTAQPLLSRASHDQATLDMARAFVRVLAAKERQKAADEQFDAAWRDAHWLNKDWDIELMRRAMMSVAREEAIAAFEAKTRPAPPPKPADNRDWLFVATRRAA